MADPHTSPHLSNDEDNKPPVPETQTHDTALVRLITINRDFTGTHAIKALSEIMTLWPDRFIVGLSPYDLYSLSRFLRQANIVVEQSHLRAFLVAWNFLDANFPSLNATGQARLIRDMVVCQLGSVEMKATGNGEGPVTTSRTRADAELVQTLSPGSPSKLLLKAHKRWARQRQLKTLISQAERLKKRKREDKAENDDTATQLDVEMVTHTGDDESELNMEPIVLSTPEKEALHLQKLERKRKLEALALKQKRRRYL